MPRCSSGPVHLPDWRTLTPAQRNALTWRLARQAHAARARAIGEALRGAVDRLLGRSTPAFVATGLPVSARRWR